MKKMSVQKMSAIQGGLSWCGFSNLMLAGSAISLYAAPFTGGGSAAIALGLFALGSFVGSAYAAGSAC
jgi:hypothetical protein